MNLQVIFLQWVKKTRVLVLPVFCLVSSLPSKPKYIVMNITGAVSFILYRRRFLNKPQTLNDKCSNPDSSGYIDDSTLRVSSQDEHNKDQITCSIDMHENFSCGSEKCISKSNLFLLGPVDIIHNPTCLIFKLKRHIQPHVS
jgi:hypothetical protein